MIARLKISVNRFKQNLFECDVFTEKLFFSIVHEIREVKFSAVIMLFMLLLIGKIAYGIKDAQNPAHFTQNEVIIEKAPVKPEIHYNQINAMGRQTSDQPGAKEAGYIDLYSYDLLKKQKN